MLAFAQVVRDAPTRYVRPNIVPPGGELLLRNCRHPVLEVQDGVHYIANDVHLRAARDDDGMGNNALRWFCDFIFFCMSNVYIIFL